MSMCVGGTSGKKKNKACNWQDLHFYQIHMRVPFVCIQASVYCLDFFFLVIIIASGERWTLNVVLICIFPMASEGISFFENCLFVSLAHLLTRLLYFLVFNFWVL